MKIDAFAIPIFHDTLDISSDVNDVLWETVIKHEQTQDRSGKNVKQTNLGLEQQYACFASLASIITNWSREKIIATGSDPELGEAMSFWANYINKPYSFHMPHAHTVNGFMWTGVYFPKGDPDEVLESSNLPKPGSLVLMDPLGAMKTSMASNKTQLWPYWGNPICIQPKESTVVIFPSYLSHMVTPTETNEERMSIAFSIAN